MAGRREAPQADARAVIILNVCGSSGIWRRVPRSRELLASLRSIITPCAGTGGTTLEARATYVAGAGATKDQLEAIVADETLALVDHYRIVRCGLYKGFTAAAELGDSNSLALLSGRLHENFRDCGRLTGELQRGPLLNVQNNILVSPDYTRAIARIVSAVAPYPQAREAVIAALRDLDGESASGPEPTDRSPERAENG